MPRETLKFSRNPEIDKDTKRKEIIKQLNIPNIIGVYANLSPEWQTDKKLALAVMNRDGLALKYASAKLQDDPEVVVAAVANTRHAFSFASQKMQAQREKIMALVHQKLSDNRGEVIEGLRGKENESSIEKESKAA